MATSGRPTKYSEEMADKICSLLSEGRSLRSICREDDMPCKASVFKWLREIDQFSDQYAKAKEEASDAMFEDIQDIADNGSNDWIEINDPDNPGYRVNGENIQRSKLRVDARKWMMSKMKPKKYGDKIQTEHSGTISHTDLTDEQLNNKLQTLLNAASQLNPTTED